MKANFIEFLGTFILVLAGTATMSLTNADPLTIGVAFGGAYAVVYFAFAAETLGEYNPAVSIALAINKKLKWADATYHIIAQIFGAILASGLVYFGALNLGTSGSSIGQTTSNLDWSLILMVEALLTFLVVLIYLQLRDSGTGYAAVFNGFLIIALCVCAYSLTGPALNPARAIGPAVYVGGKAFTQLWIYVLGGVIGGICAAYAHRFLATDK